MAFTTNLYPPMVMDSLPAFIRTKSCHIYFSLSSFNKKSDIRTDSVQITITNAYTNQSILNSEKYPSEIKIATLYKDQSIENEFCYYIIINPKDDLKDGKFGLNQTYKVQLRFTSIDIPTGPPSSGTGLATWLYDYKDYFSEWSSICLIRGINQPKIELSNLKEDHMVTFSNQPTELVGKLYYEFDAEGQEQESLKSYNIKVYAPGRQIIYQNQFYTNEFNPNEFICKLPYDFKNLTKYTINFSYETTNMYTDEKQYAFLVDVTETQLLPVSIAATANNQAGCIEIHLESDENITFQGTLIVKRTSSKTDFSLWETVKIIEYPQDTQTFVNLTFQDTSIESGVWYKYRVEQKKDSNTKRKPVQIEAPIICVFQDIFLIHDNLQLKIQFNPLISGFKYNVTQSQQQTLGSQYPFIRINGKTKYRSFSLSGLISSLSDRTDWFKNNAVVDNSFTSKAELYKTAQPLYNQYNLDNNVPDYLDILYEKAFRDKVFDFLYGNNLKLFKSTTEGNILIRLVDVSFEPLNQLGRSLYSFSATAIEVDEATIDNYMKYNIISDKITYYKDDITLAPKLDFDFYGVLTIDAFGVESNDTLFLEEIMTKERSQWK